MVFEVNAVYAVYAVLEVPAVLAAFEFEVPAAVEEVLVAVGDARIVVGALEVRSYPLILLRDSVPSGLSLLTFYGLAILFLTRNRGFLLLRLA